MAGPGFSAALVKMVEMQYSSLRTRSASLRGHFSRRTKPGRTPQTSCRASLFAQLQGQTVQQPKGSQGKSPQVCLGFEASDTVQSWKRAVLAFIGFLYIAIG